jgi:hypothetical protein
MSYYVCLSFVSGGASLESSAPPRLNQAQPRRPSASPALAALRSPVTAATPPAGPVLPSAPAFQSRLAPPGGGRPKTRCSSLPVPRLFHGPLLFDSGFTYLVVVGIIVKVVGAPSAPPYPLSPAQPALPCLPRPTQYTLDYSKSEHPFYAVSYLPKEFSPYRPSRRLLQSGLQGLDQHPGSA